MLQQYFEFMNDLLTEKKKLNRADRQSDPAYRDRVLGDTDIPADNPIKSFYRDRANRLAASQEPADNWMHDAAVDDNDVIAHQRADLGTGARGAEQTADLNRFARQVAQGKAVKSAATLDRATIAKKTKDLFEMVLALANMDDEYHEVGASAANRSNADKEKETERAIAKYMQNKIQYSVANATAYSEVANKTNDAAYTSHYDAVFTAVRNRSTMTPAEQKLVKSEKYDARIYFGINFFPKSTTVTVFLDAEDNELAANYVFDTFTGTKNIALANNIITAAEDTLLDLNKFTELLTTSMAADTKPEQEEIVATAKANDKFIYTDDVKLERKRLKAEIDELKQKIAEQEGYVEANGEIDNDAIATALRGYSTDPEEMKKVRQARKINGVTDSAYIDRMYMQLLRAEEKYAELGDEQRQANKVLAGPKTDAQRQDDRTRRANNMLDKAKRLARDETAASVNGDEATAAELAAKRADLETRGNKLLNTPIRTYAKSVAAIKNDLADANNRRNVNAFKAVAQDQLDARTKKDNIVADRAASRSVAGNVKSIKTNAPKKPAATTKFAHLFDDI